MYASILRDFKSKSSCTTKPQERILLNAQTSQKFFYFLQINHWSLRHIRIIPIAIVGATGARDLATHQLVQVYINNHPWLFLFFSLYLNSDIQNY